MSDERYTKKALSSLASTIVEKAPYFGSLPLPTDAFKIYFDDKHGQARAVNTANATGEELNMLAEACSVAPFGRGAEAVVDDTYRKAGKLDLPHFAIPFEPETTALVAGIRESVLEGQTSKRPIRFELYKLNVYGEGGFFKAHQDTPRGAAMFGSLVLVYPTTHFGGALVFRHQGREWTFNSAAAVSQDGAPAFGYAAFYSDVEHEVLPVISGYRLTVTYNLYFDDADDAADGTQTSAAPATEDATFATQLQSLLDDPQFLPHGGYLGFGLRHAYPIKFNESFSPEREEIQYLLDMLKGADATVLRAARAVGLSTQLHVAYDTEMEVEHEGRELTVLTTQVVGGSFFDSSFWYYLKEYHDAALLWPKGHKKYQVEREVHWVTSRTGGSRFKTVMLAYGNEPELDYHYAELCLLVAIGPSGARTEKDNLTKIEPRKRRPWNYSAYDKDDYVWPAINVKNDGEEEDWEEEDAHMVEDDEGEDEEGE